MLDCAINCVLPQRIPAKIRTKTEIKRCHIEIRTIFRDFLRIDQRYPGKFSCSGAVCLVLF
jgi:hypothetical protein